MSATGKGGHTISIHALREEGDGTRLFCACPSNYFYPRPPRGGRPMGDRAYIKFVIFLSTPSARRATLCCTGAGCKTLISIHALREEGDKKILLDV